MNDDKKSVKLPHNIIMEDRKKIMMTGILNVESFDDQAIVLLTDMGELTVRGDALHVNKFNIENGELSMEGSIYALVYTNDNKKGGGGFFGRLFR